MKFSDLSIGDTFMFNDDNLDGVRYRKISDDTIKAFKGNSVTQFTLNKEAFDEPVKFVGKNFDHNERIQNAFIPESKYRMGYVFESGDNGSILTDRKVTIEDIINADFGNHPRYADYLVLFSDEDPSLIVDFSEPVKRTGTDLLELTLPSFDPKGTSIIKYQQTENGDFQFSVLANGEPTSELLSLGAESTLKFFLENEILFANTKTLREHEQDFLAAKRERDMASKDAEKELPRME